MVVPLMSFSLSNDQLQHFKSILIEDRTLIQDQQNSKKEPNRISSQSNVDAELSTYDNHMADQATELYEQERDKAIDQAQLRQLEQINNALQKINDGSYGVCEACHQPIEAERLEAIPETKYCQQHSQQFQQHGDQYEYEPIPMTQLNLDDTEYTGFDGEDMNQALISFGNSNHAQLASSMLDSEFAEEITDENSGHVEPLESFIATDITGKNVHIVRNAAYERYIRNREGDDELELL